MGDSQPDPTGLSVKRDDPCRAMTHQGRNLRSRPLAPFEVLFRKLIAAAKAASSDLGLFKGHEPRNTELRFTGGLHELTMFADPGRLQREFRGPRRHLALKHPDQIPTDVAQFRSFRFVDWFVRNALRNVQMQGWRHLPKEACISKECGLFCWGRGLGPFEARPGVEPIFLHGAFGLHEAKAPH